MRRCTFKDRRIKPCKGCGGNAVLETWSSGGTMFAVRCDNPDRPTECDEGFYRSKCNDPDEAIARWNEEI